MSLIIKSISNPLLFNLDGKDGSVRIEWNGTAFVYTDFPAGGVVLPPVEPPVPPPPPPPVTGEEQLKVQIAMVTRVIPAKSVKNFYFIVPKDLPYITGQMQSIDLASDANILMSDVGYVTYEQALGITLSTNKNPAAPPWFGFTGSSNEKVTIAKAFKAGQKIFLTVVNRWDTQAVVGLQWY